MSTTPSNFFQTMCGFARKTRRIRMAAPDDILREEKVWSPEQLMVPVLQRGEPMSVKLHTKPGAPTIDFDIRALSMSEKEAAERILDAALPPQSFVDELPDKPGQPTKRINTGSDYDDPKYLADLRPLQSKQAAFVVLKGVENLEADTPGEDEAAKTEEIMKQMPDRMIRYIASQVWNMTYAGGDVNDFFTSEDSKPSPRSESSPRQNRQGGKQK